MSGPRRYGQCTNLGGDYWLEENDEGDFVSFSDYEALEKRLRAENERLTAERNALRDYAFEATKAITNLTVGGSEFFGKRIGEMYTADLPYCVEHIRVRMGYHMDAMRANARALAAEARAEKAVEDMRERAAKVAIREQYSDPQEDGARAAYRIAIAIRSLASLPKESADAD